MNPQFWNLFLACGLDAPRANRLLEELRETSLDPIAFLNSWPGLTEGNRKAMKHVDGRTLEAALAQGAWVWDPPDYRVEDPRFFAPVLFGIGQRPKPGALRVGIVGTRSASPYGLACAKKFGEGLAAMGIEVVSGGALGIDTASHQGALAVDGVTHVVLPSGIDVTYPPANKSLFERIRVRGSLLSQNATGSPAIAHRIPERNPTIAALSDVLVVIEAPEKSGSLQTALAAAEQNKTVLVVPGPVTLDGFRGSHRLIRDGATLVTHPFHVAEELGIDPVAPMESVQPANELQAAILAALDAVPVATDKIAERVGMDTATIAAELTEMELEGLVMRAGIGYSLKP